MIKRLVKSALRVLVVIMAFPLFASVPQCHHTPAAIGHLGEGSGTFSADPSWENAPGVLSDVLTVGAVLSATASALPSLNGSAAAAAAPNRGAGALDDLATTPLNRNITGVADDALVHFSPEGYSVIKPGVGGETFTFRYGDIKHLTPKQIETVIGPLSRGGQTGGTRVMHVLEDAISGATRTPGAVVSEIPEYILTKPSTVSGGFVVQ